MKTDNSVKGLEMKKVKSTTIFVLKSISLPSILLFLLIWVPKWSIDHSISSLIYRPFESIVLLTMLLDLALKPCRPKNKLKEALFAGKCITHVTPVHNQHNIINRNIANIKHSKGVLANIGNLSVGKSAFFFLGKPNRCGMFSNLFGRHKLEGNCIIFVSGCNMKEKAFYTRLIDQAILVPGGYTGPATVRTISEGN